MYFTKPPSKKIEKKSALYLTRERLRNNLYYVFLIYLRYVHSNCLIKCFFHLKFKIKMEPKHPLLVALGEISGEDYVLETLKKTKSRFALKIFAVTSLVIQLIY